MDLRKGNGELNFLFIKKKTFSYIIGVLKLKQSVQLLHFQFGFVSKILFTDPYFRETLKIDSHLKGKDKGR